MRPILPALLTLLLAGCAAAPAAVPAAVPGTGGAVPPTTEQLYDAALRDSAVPDPAAVYDGLWALVRTTPKLVWDGPGPDARVRVATLMSEQAFQKYYAAPPDERTNANAWGVIWVTPVPQLQEFCLSVPGDTDTKVDRLKQFLGLKPSASYARVVELWVHPSDLARPCPDPEVTDSTCTLDPATTGPGGDATYVNWFVGNYQPSYRYDGYPWTRLGYTYDWAPPTDRFNPARPVGGSEYILAPKAPYTIAARYAVAEYCGN